MWWGANMIIASIFAFFYFCLCQGARNHCQSIPDFPPFLLESVSLRFWTSQSNTIRRVIVPLDIAISDTLDIYISDISEMPHARIFSMIVFSCVSKLQEVAESQYSISSQVMWFTSCLVSYPHIIMFICCPEANWRPNAWIYKPIRSSSVLAVFVWKTKFVASLWL